MTAHVQMEKELKILSKKELSKNNYCLVSQKNTLAAIIKEKASDESCSKNTERRRKKNNFAGSRR